MYLCQISDSELNSADSEDSENEQVFLASPLKPITLAAFQAEHDGDPAFNRFHTKIGRYIASHVGRSIQLTGDTEVSALDYY